MGDNLADVTITDDDATPGMTVASLSHPEGTGITSVVGVTLMLSAPAGRSYDIPFQTVGAGATGDVDFAIQSGKATIKAGETTAVVDLVVAGDDELEDDEGVAIEATAPTGELTTGVVTIVDDDLTAANTPRLSIGGATVVEGDRGTRTARFPVSLERPMPRAVVAEVETLSGTAKVGEDLRAAPAELVIAAGATRGEVLVEVIGDRLFESNHSYSLRLVRPRNARLGTAVATGIITDDDAGLDNAGITPSRSIGVGRLLCTARCPGVLVRYSAASAGTLRVRVDGIAPPRTAKAKGSAKLGARYIRFVDVKASVEKGAGSRTVRRAGRGASALVRRLRALGVKTVRITVTFTNRRGAAETRAFRLTLKT